MTWMSPKAIRATSRSQCRRDGFCESRHPARKRVFQDTERTAIQRKEWKGSKTVNLRCFSATEKQEEWICRTISFCMYFMPGRSTLHAAVHEFTQLGNRQIHQRTWVTTDNVGDLLASIARLARTKVRSDNAAEESQGEGGTPPRRNG